jgi:DNA-directed RNA polymerase subunit RPC12/RpoP
MPTCTNCGRTAPGMANLYDHTEVIEGPGGAVTTRDEIRLEYRCRWCGTRLGPGRTVTVEDVASL